MVQVIEPEYTIKIGIKDGEIVLVDWSELPKQFENKDHDVVIESVKNYLKKANKFMSKQK